MSADQLRLERIKAAQEAARQAVGCHLLTTQSVQDLVRDVIAAYDPPPKPKWPVDESVFAINKCRRSGALIEDVRDATREAMLADPIIKAAIHLRDIAQLEGAATPETMRRAQAVRDAVREAGL